jgi:GNAT superfamily N-acetyltransferase
MKRGRVKIKRAEGEDYEFLREMLYEAADWRLPASRRRSLEEVLSDEHVARYIQGWGREGGVGVVALAEGAPVGAAWYRFLSAAEPGYGFIDEAVPEVTVAVSREWRGRGIGEALMQALIEEARKESVTSLSLSVEEDNPAVLLYERCGFVKVDRVHNAWTMRADVIPV